MYVFLNKKKFAQRKTITYYFEEKKVFYYMYIKTKNSIYVGNRL